jgi:SAM-dependent methyltransferase
MDAEDGNWFESESLWSRLFPYMFVEQEFAAAIENVPKIVAISGISSGALLDLACGPGRCAVPFAQAGFRVTGVDRTRFLLDKARERVANAGVSVELVEQDMREFVRPSAFDLAINVYTSFGYFEDAAENRRVLENVFASLKPGGAFVFEHIGKEILAGKFQPTGGDAFPDGSVLFQRRSVVDDWSKIDAEWILVEENRATRFHLRHWIYSGREIHDLFSGVGFADVRLYGSFDGTPYGPQALRLIAVARKPA